MRPIDTSKLAEPRPEILKESVAIVEAGAEDVESLPSASTVEDEVAGLEKMLRDSYDPAGKWPKGVFTRKANRLADEIAGWREPPTGALIALTGPYCAYCETAEPTGLCADPIMPPRLFPREAFRPNGWLLACPTCRKVKADRLGRRGGQLCHRGERLIPAWPHIYWQSLADGSPLPVVCRLYESGQPHALGQAVDPASPRMQQLVEAWRRGRIAAEGAPLRCRQLVLRPADAPEAAAEEPPRQAASGIGARDLREAERSLKRKAPAQAAAVPAPTFLTVQIEAGQGPLQRDIGRMIELLGLNCRDDSEDRRPELRARTFLFAVDFRWKIHALLSRKASEAEIQAVFALIERCIRATGHWSVWASVFGPQDRLAGLLPGTAERRWRA